MREPRRNNEQIPLCGKRSSVYHGNVLKYLHPRAYAITHSADKISRLSDTGSLLVFVLEKDIYMKRCRWCRSHAPSDETNTSLAHVQVCRLQERYLNKLGALSTATAFLSILLASFLLPRGGLCVCEVSQEPVPR